MPRGCLTKYLVPGIGDTIIPLKRS